MNKQWRTAAIVSVLVPSVSWAQTRQAEAAPTGQQAGHHKGHSAQIPMSDHQFVPMTIQHHKDGIEMTQIAESQATVPEMKALAAKIRAGQERELKEIEAFQSSGSVTGTVGQDDQHHAAMMKESQTSIARVRNATGKELDRAFLEEMAKHHQMPIDMVQSTTFENARLKETATRMRASQTRELQELKAMRQRVS